VALRPTVSPALLTVTVHGRRRQRVADEVGRADERDRAADRLQAVRVDAHARRPPSDDDLVGVVAGLA